MVQPSATHEGSQSVAPLRPLGAMVLTSRRYPIYYLPITKCGSTFLKSLFYTLDHDEMPPEQIHDEDRLIRAGDLEPAFIAGSRFGFAVLRDPAERAVSFYLDKIARYGPGSFPDIRAVLVKDAGLDLPADKIPDLSVEDHRRNCHRFADWLEDNLAGRMATPVNPHWRRQSQRLRRAAPLALTHLTLDGLDVQLPRLLKPVIADIEQRMAATATRNAHAYGRLASILTPDLTARLHGLYRRDVELVESARARWARRQVRGWRNGLERPAPNRATLSLTSCHRAPLMFMPVPKVGCTLLRNLAYLLDHGRPHPDPLTIQADRCLHSRRVTARGHEGRAFIVLRNPVARFLSLYFDKVVGTGPHAFPWIARRLASQDGFALARDLPAENHRQNCHLFLDFIERRIRTQKPAEVNGHWRPQSVFAARARRFGLHALTLENVEAQLIAHLGDAIPGLDALFARLGRLNRSAHSEDGSGPAIIDHRLESRILAVYGADRELHRRVTAAWEQSGRAPLV